MSPLKSESNRPYVTDKECYWGLNSLSGRALDERKTNNQVGHVSFTQRTHEWPMNIIKDVPPY